MTATAAHALRMLAPATPDSWPAGILAAADVRQARAEAAAVVSPGPWYADAEFVYGRDFADGSMRHVAEALFGEVAEHIAAEASPAHALAAVRHWRGTVGRHGRALGRFGWCDTCGKVNGNVSFPCPDLVAVADEARAYIGGSS